MASTSSRNAGAGIGHGDLDHVVGRPGTLDDDQLAARRLRHRLERVAEQIDQHLLDLDPVDQHQSCARVEIEAQLHALLAGAGEAERAGLLDQLGEAFDALLGFAARDEIAQPPDDLAGAQRLLGGAVHRALDLSACWDRCCRSAAGASPSCSC